MVLHGLKSQAGVVLGKGWIIMNALESHVAVVTGAARGVGKAIAHRLASMGAHVLLVARNRNELNQVCDQIVGAGGAASVFPSDLMNASDVAELGRAVAEKHERCDILVKQRRDWHRWKIPA